jgi:hypothetical protein
MMRSRSCSRTVLSLKSRDYDLRFAAGSEAWRRPGSGFVHEKPVERNANSPLVSCLKP